MATFTYTELRKPNVWVRAINEKYAINASGVIGWHVVQPDKRLAYSDNRKVIAGKTVGVRVTPAVGCIGLHAELSICRIWAANKHYICLVRCFGKIDAVGAIVSSTKRHVFVMREIDATAIRDIMQSSTDAFSLNHKNHKHIDKWYQNPQYIAGRNQIENLANLMALVEMGFEITLVDK